MMLKKLYLWLFTEEERGPVGFIPMFSMTILLSTTITLFILAIQ